MSEPEPIAVTVTQNREQANRDGDIVDLLPLQLPSGSQVSDALRAAEIPAYIEIILTVNGEVEPRRRSDQRWRSNFAFSYSHWRLSEVPPFSTKNSCLFPLPCCILQSTYQCALQSYCPPILVYSHQRVVFT
jgi:sulfur carrier protein ThiS